jgi:hypothetical protein
MTIGKIEDLGIERLVEIEKRKMARKEWKWIMGSSELLYKSRFYIEDDDHEHYAMIHS